MLAEEVPLRITEQGYDLYQMSPGQAEADSPQAPSVAKNVVNSG